MVGTTQPLFLETVSPEIRKVLVAERLRAMRGRLREVLPRLQGLVENTPREKTADTVALGLLWSELLHLDGGEDDALLIFRTVVESRQDALPTAGQLVVSDNLSMLQMASMSGEGVATFYRLVDRRRAAQFEWSDSLDLLEAQGAIEKENYNEALPPLWRNLLRAHTLGSWRESRWAAERYGKLCLKVGALEEACHYLIVAEAEKEVKSLAVMIACRRDVDLIRAVLRRLMVYANLRRHFIVACKLLAEIPDLVPDDELPAIAEWLLPRCQELPIRNGGGAMRAAWEALRELGSRLPTELSKRMIEVAVSHPVWQAPPPGENRVQPNRKDMVEAVTFLAHSAPAEYLPQIVDGTIPLATVRRQDYDYAAVVNLLCNLAELGGPALKSKIATALYTAGNPVNRILAQLTGFFGVEALTPQQWEAFAERVIEETRLTVQRLKPGETPKPVPETLMTMHQTTTQGQIQVSVHGGVGLEALAREKRKLSDGTVARLIRVLVEMATDRDNLLTNRELLLSQLCEYADRADERLRDEVVRAIEPLARGEVLESSEYPSSAAGMNPLASARMRMGTPEEVQAMALVAVATFSGSEANRIRRISETLAEGFVHPNVKVRSGANAAARRLPALSTEHVLPILMGLRDPDPSAAASAFAAFAERKEWTLTRPMWKLFLLAVRLTGQSPDVKLRRYAAYALRELLGNAPTVGIRDDAQSILDSFGMDIAHSVREAAKTTHQVRPVS
jgi:hypothetical protein